MMMLFRLAPANTLPILHGLTLVTQLLHWTSLLSTPRTKPAPSCLHSETYFWIHTLFSRFSAADDLGRSLSLRYLHTSRPNCGHEVSLPGQCPSTTYTSSISAVQGLRLDSVIRFLFPCDRLRNLACYHCLHSSRPSILSRRSCRGILFFFKFPKNQASLYSIYNRRLISLATPPESAFPGEFPYN